MADLQGIACVVCGSETFEETDDGFYVCRRCGTQSQDVRKEVHDEDAALNMGLVGRGARSRRVRDPERVRLGADGRVVQRPGDGPLPKTAEEIAKERRAEGDAITARVRAYEEGLRDIMNAICDALVHAHGVDPEVREHAANIWRGYVTHTGILTKDFGNPSTFANPRRSFGKRAGRGPTWINGASKKPQKKSDSRKRKRAQTKDRDADASSDSDRPTSSSGDDASSDDDEERDTREGAPGKPLTLRRLVSKHLPPRTTLAVAYLASAAVRAPCHPGDFNRWALEGDVPYLGYSADVSARCREEGKTLPWPNALTQRAAPLADKIAQSADAIASALSLTLPPCNALALCERYVTELGLHPAVTDVAWRLIGTHEVPGLTAHIGVGSASDGVGGAGFKNKKEIKSAAPPHAHAMGYVVAALKVLHGLDGRTHTDYGDVMAPSGGWVGRRTEARRAGRNAVPTTRRGAHKTKNFKKEEGAGGDDDVTDSVSNGTSMRIDPPSEGWTAWAERTMRTGASVPRLPVRVAEAATREPETGNSGDGRDLESVDAFLEYCRTHALRGLRSGLPEAHRRTVDALWRVHATGGGSVGAAEEEVPESDQSLQAAAPGPAMISEAARPPASTRAHTSSSPPIVRFAGDYFVCRDTRKHGRAAGDLESVPFPEYRAVVSACAGHAWVSAQALHDCVRAIDAGLMAREREERKGVSKRGTRVVSDRNHARALSDESFALRYLEVAELPKFPETTSDFRFLRLRSPDGNHAGEDGRKQLAVMPPPPPRSPATGGATKTPKTAKKKTKRRRVDGF